MNITVVISWCDSVVGFPKSCIHIAILHNDMNGIIASDLQLIIIIILVCNSITYIWVYYYYIFSSYVAYSSYEMCGVILWASEQEQIDSVMPQALLISTCECIHTQYKRLAFCHECIIIQLTVLPGTSDT